MIRRHFLLAAFLAASGGPAAAVDNPARFTGGMIVSAEQARDLVAKGAKIVDVRSGNEFAEGHVKGAMHVPYKEKSEKNESFDAKLDSFEISKLGDKYGQLIFYCNGLECWKSYKAATSAVRAGYRRVYWMRGGIPEWKGKGFPIE